jgi:hypothetical protein
MLVEHLPIGFTSLDAPRDLPRALRGLSVGCSHPTPASHVQ